MGTEIACLVEEWPAELLNVAEDNDYQSYVDMDGEEYQFVKLDDKELIAMADFL